MQCVSCLKEINNERFCSRSCAVSFNNRGICRTKKNPDKFCVRCGKKIDPKSKRFCSYECDLAFEWEQKVKEIESTGIVKNLRNAKRYLRENRGNKCEICGIVHWMDKLLVLVLDHIDGNAENFHISNLRLLCPNCDSQTPTYKGKNKGNGRYIRRKRYAEGKSC